MVRGQAHGQPEEREEEEAKEDEAKDEAFEEQTVGSPARWLWVPVQLQSMISSPLSSLSVLLTLCSLRLSVDPSCHGWYFLGCRRP